MTKKLGSPEDFELSMSEVEAHFYTLRDEIERLRGVLLQIRTAWRYEENAKIGQLIADALDGHAHETPARLCKAQRTADPPQDCDWPHCGCDPAATKVLEALQEEGWSPPVLSLADRVRASFAPGYKTCCYRENCDQPAYDVGLEKCPSCGTPNANFTHMRDRPPQKANERLAGCRNWKPKHGVGPYCGNCGFHENEHADLHR